MVTRVLPIFDLVVSNQLLNAEWQDIISARHAGISLSRKFERISLFYRNEEYLNIIIRSNYHTGYNHMDESFRRSTFFTLTSEN